MSNPFFRQRVAHSFLGKVLTKSINPLATPHAPYPRPLILRPAPRPAATPTPSMGPVPRWASAPATRATDLRMTDDLRILVPTPYCATVSTRLHSAIRWSMQVVAALELACRVVLALRALCCLASLHLGGGWPPSRRRRATRRWLGGCRRS